MRKSRRSQRGNRVYPEMVIYPDADISEPDNDTDEDLAKELFDASDDDDIKKVQEGVHRSSY
ncbi:hypothetical protein T03_12060 [Trichinella britovi]|uniref:Uncharacterized protein n=1 Tax=Trichinella britovi TaxID=45882 RepID=A0A0V1CYP3_TRIBR|nr:hypothetical protein T09_4744 [Trichinella sp. T9]KRY54254.1 hypothetical protein T03_12060 [Trichinella britovi]